MNTHDLDSSNAVGESKENLAYAVTEMMRAAGHPAPEVWMQGLHPDIWITNDQGLQRFHINRYWRVQIGALEEDTIDIRYCLVDTGQIADWLRLFGGEVVKCIIKHKLPLTTS
jgi:hypothetical protein